MLKNENEEKYFVITEADEPVRIYFDADSAFKPEHEYVDSFDKNGEVVKRYWFNDGAYDIIGP